MSSDSLSSTEDSDAGAVLEIEMKDFSGRSSVTSSPLSTFSPASPASFGISESPFKLSSPPKGQDEFFTIEI
ncbi:MAG: hypothetical protein SGCHY_003296 [Lobulomycetales sp.]